MKFRILSICEFGVEEISRFEEWQACGKLL
jgi:hypothetical protein